MQASQLSSEFESFRGQLKAYILRMTASVQDTDDIVQDTFVKALTKIDSFQGESTLKTWVFAIASNIARDHLRAKKRWPETVTDICKTAALSDPEHFPESMRIAQTSPQGKFEIKEHIAFCFTCISKSLPLEQHLAILLKEVHDFKLKEIATIMNISEDMVKYHLHTGRSKMIQVFDGRCSLVNKEGVCHQCTEINGIFNPKQDAEEESNKLKLVRDAAKGNKEHLFDLRMQLVQEIDPFESDGAALELHHLEFNRKTMEAHLAKSQE